MKILFIGNSYTFYNDMPTAYFEALAREFDPDVEVFSVTCGGWTLEKFADAKIPLGKQIEDILGQEQYDVVILQEQSVRPAAEHGYATFYDGARRLCKKIAKNGSRVVFYATWSHETDSHTLQKYGWTHEEMTWRLASSYQAIAEELGAEVAHVGLAFREIVRSHPKIDLYAHDSRSHPSPRGSYLAALTLFAKIFGKNPCNTYFQRDFSDEEAAALRLAAKNAVFQAPEIPSAYRRSSNGISAS